MPASNKRQRGDAKPGAKPAAAAAGDSDTPAVDLLVSLRVIHAANTKIKEEQPPAPEKAAPLVQDNPVAAVRPALPPRRRPPPDRRGASVAAPRARDGAPEADGVERARARRDVRAPRRAYGARPYPTSHLSRPG